MSARVRVPASSSNLGSGFDCVGVAVDRWLVATVIPEPGNLISIENRGSLAAVSVPVSGDLLARGFRAACAAAGVSPTGAAIDATSDIPVGCGLGSSAAALVAGVLLADAALELNLTPQQIVEIATAIEGHPDNVAPAVYGGARTALSVRYESCARAIAKDTAAQRCGVGGEPSGRVGAGAVERRWRAARRGAR